MSAAGDPDTSSLNKDEAMEDKHDDTQNALPTAQQITSEMMQNPQVLAALQQRLDHIVGSTSGYIESLPKSIKRRIHALKNLQVATSQIESKFYEEVHELERKYSALYQPLFDKRSDIVTGGYEPTEKECEWESEDEDFSDEEEGTKIKEIDETKKDEVEMENMKTDDTKGVPSFWLTIFKNVPLLQEMIQDHDEPILEKLIDIKVTFSTPEETMGFTLEFHFDTNKYFTNKVLTKYYNLQAEPDEKVPFSFEGPEIVGCTGCKIDWNKGQNVTVKTVKKKQKHKGKGTIRTVTKQLPNDSFFNFFNPPEVPEDEEEMDPDTEALLASDFEIGHLIRDRIIPRAVLYFTGEIDEDFDEEGEEEEDDDENDFHDDDDSNSDNDPDFDPDKLPKEAKETPQECNQQ